MSLSSALWRRRPRASRPGPPTARTAPRRGGRPSPRTPTGPHAGSGQGKEGGRIDDRSVRDRCAADLDLVQRRLAADPAGRRGDEVALRNPARVERVDQVDGLLVVRLRVDGGVAGGHALDARDVVDEALGAQEPDGELGLVTGRPHRDRDVHRQLPRAAGADRHRLLAREPIVAHLDTAGAIRRHPRPRGLARRGLSGTRHPGILPAPDHTAGMPDPVEILAGDAWSFVAAARRATLATVDPQGQPRLVPVCFVLLGGTASQRRRSRLDCTRRWTRSPSGSPIPSPWPASATSGRATSSGCSSIAGTRTGRAWAGCACRVARRSWFPMGRRPTSAMPRSGRCAPSTRSTGDTGSTRGR